MHVLGAGKRGGGRGQGGEAATGSELLGVSFLFFISGSELLFFFFCIVCLFA